MRSLFLFLFIGTLLYSCTTSKKIVNNSDSATIEADNISHDGSSFEKAIIINEKSEFKGIEAEYAWLRKNYPGYKSKQQSLLSHDGKSYDRLDIITSDGEEKSIYFDISNFFGKY
jgi:hypothetical protein